MLNFRKLKQDFSSSILKEGRALYDQDVVLSAKVLELTPDMVRVSASVLGSFDNTYTCELEIDRYESEAMDSNCDCPYNYDCQHLAALVFYLEKNLDSIVVAYSKEANVDDEDIDDEEKEQLLETIKEAEDKETKRQDEQFQRELLEEYSDASGVLSLSPFFRVDEASEHDKGQLLILIHPPNGEDRLQAQVQIALRLPYRSKPLHIPHIREFVESIRYREAIELGGRTHHFGLQSFESESSQLLRLIMDFAQFQDESEERNQKFATMDNEALGMLLATANDLALARARGFGPDGIGDEPFTLPGLYLGSLEEPVAFAPSSAHLRFQLECIESPSPKLFLQPLVQLNENEIHRMDELLLFECAKPGVLQNALYYRFKKVIKRSHLKNLVDIQDMTIPEPLFGTFVENALPALSRYAELGNSEAIEKFVTLPYVDELRGFCEIHYLDGELDAQLYFRYGEAKVPALASKSEIDHIREFITEEGILARNLTEERELMRGLFQGFVIDEEQGVFRAKTDKRIIEFMTETIPSHQHQVDFRCPRNLLDRFIYDDTTFTLEARESKDIDKYEVELKVDGPLQGVTVDLLWECLSAQKAYIELSRPTAKGRGRSAGGQAGQKILVLDLEKLTPVVRIFDEVGLQAMESHVEQRPLWSLVSLVEEQFDDLPIKFTMTAGLKKLQKQMLGQSKLRPSAIPKTIQASLRSYQKEGVHWLERLRKMHLSGILADDMGLGKTLQAIIAVTQNKAMNPNAISLVVCPTSLVYNWEEEFHKFNPELNVLPVDGTPAQRKKLLKTLDQQDVIITSYSLLQKDVEIYKKTHFSYAILDEAQHIKNRGTRNAKSVKMIDASHRLILTGTPIENSLEELWSLFDFLMPGLLSSYDRFVEKYIRAPTRESSPGMEQLRRKVAPFILRRMKTDVLDDLPPVSQIVYHCHLSPTQKELYKSYADSARQELQRLVKKEGFDRVQIHVLATLTRLKQICCHPAIFAKERPEGGDSAKYEMLLELLPTLMEGRHKTVIFSQYTQMLKIMRGDLERMGIRYSYLDGSSKNRQQIVNEFNEDSSISAFLVSLKAGGAGLNLASADTVIHYDMWWNPAVENQATDRVHRIGQQRSVSSYKLVTMGTIEEKILELQERKKGLVKQVVGCDDEAISKLTWEEVLELLQT